jgi:NAD-dependent dihydropyrimidine dehydrogenase PreA subunit
MAVRNIIIIDEDKCDGCGVCVPACHEGAIQVIDGKARLVNETYCDGLGDCLGECPQDAITIEEREAADFDEKAVQEHLTRIGRAAPKPAAAEQAHHGGGCPGSAMRSFDQPAPARATATATARQSQLGHWPVQLMLVPPAAPFLKGADILLAADCVPFATANFHEHYLAGKSVIVGCPKLDDIGYYQEKLKAIFAEAKPHSVTVVRMEVPCCGGIASAAIQARNEVAPDTKLEVVTVGIRGDELGREEVAAA